MLSRGSRAAVNSPSTHTAEAFRQAPRGGEGEGGNSGFVRLEGEEERVGGEGDEAGQYFEDDEEINNNWCIFSAESTIDPISEMERASRKSLHLENLCL